MNGVFAEHVFRDFMAFYFWVDIQMRLAIRYLKLCAILVREAAVRGAHRS